METRNSKVLASFVAYCQRNPSERFWQALLNWSKMPFILISSEPPFDQRLVDPYNWEGRCQDSL